MKAVILDFSDGKVKIINNIPKEYQLDDFEIFLSEKYNFSISNIEYMLVPELEIETL